MVAVVACSKLGREIPLTGENRWVVINANCKGLLLFRIINIENDFDLNYFDLINSFNIWNLLKKLNWFIIQA